MIYLYLYKLNYLELEKNQIKFINDNIDLYSFYNAYKSHYPLYKKPSKEFLEWFIGFFEGNGRFINFSNKRVAITIVQKEKQILDLIVSNLKLGNVQIHSKKKQIYQ
jgi:hypothetical protein